MDYDKKEIIKKFDELRKKHGSSLFFHSNIFNKNIVIMDMEMNGQRYFPEIIEFFGIKINNGNIIDSLYFECKPKKKIVKEVIEKVTGKDNAYYLDKKPIEEYKDLLVSFLDDSILCCYDWNYDFKTLIEEYKRKFKIYLSIKTKIIDAAFLLKTFLNIKSNIALNKKRIINGKIIYHNAIDDVFKLIELLYDLNYFLDRKDTKLYDTLFNLLNNSMIRKEIKEEKEFIKNYRNSKKNNNKKNKDKIIYSESF